MDITSKEYSINRINELSKQIEETYNYSRLMSLREDYAINLANKFGGFSWDYLPKGKFNKK